MTGNKKLQTTRRTVLAGALGMGLAACSAEKSKNGGTSPAGSGSATSTAAGGTSSTPTASAKTLPGGGRTLFPEHRLVGYCGMPGAPALGELGATSDLQAQVDKMLKLVKQYDDGSAKPLPTMELITTVVHPFPGKDGMFRERLDPKVIGEWSTVAEDNGCLLLLDIQPGLASFLDEAKAYEQWLLKPHISLALDPEWAVKPGQIPGRVFGTTTGGKVDEVAAYLSGLVQENALPQKPLIVHVLRRSILTEESALKQHPGVVTIKSVDGIGVPADKVKAYDLVMKGTPSHIKPGFKIFYSEDTAGGGPLMQPKDVLELTPVPDYVMYE